MSVSDVKLELRRFVRLTRGARSEADRRLAGTNFTTNLSALIAEEQWSLIAAFIPTDSEPAITGLLETLVEHGIRVDVPVSSPNGILEWIALSPGFSMTLAADSQGMPIPSSGDRGNTEPDVVFVPAAAVDRDGNRLGWGKGYYDRFLATIDPSTPVVAVVFDSDVVVEVPAEPHDISVDVIVTERDIYRVQ